MLLAVDIGNTETTWGIFSNDELLNRWSTATVVNRTADEYGILLESLLGTRGYSSSLLKSAAICSVVPPLTGIVTEMLGEKTGASPLVTGPGVKTGIKIRIDNPREAGADRIVDAVAAHHLYPGAVIIVDMGTATTFDTVSADGDYLGGAIAPGLKTAMEALYLRTAMLPRIELVTPQKAIGTSTVTAMQSGLVFGYVSLVEGMVKRIKKELGRTATVVATGGLAALIARETPVIDILNPDLTLIGLNLVSRLNQDSRDRP